MRLDADLAELVGSDEGFETMTSLLSKVDINDKIQAVLKTRTKLKKSTKNMTKLNTPRPS